MKSYRAPAGTQTAKSTTRRVNGGENPPKGGRGPTPPKPEPPCPQQAVRALPEKSAGVWGSPLGKDNTAQAPFIMGQQCFCFKEQTPHRLPLTGASSVCLNAPKVAQGSLEDPSAPVAQASPFGTEVSQQSRFFGTLNTPQVHGRGMQPPPRQSTPSTGATLFFLSKGG